MRFVIFVLGVLVGVGGAVAYMLFANQVSEAPPPRPWSSSVTSPPPKVTENGGFAGIALGYMGIGRSASSVSGLGSAVALYSLLDVMV